MSNAQGSEVDISKIVGGGYKKFWNTKKRYRIVKGGRGSKKSTTAALWYIYNMMKFYDVYGLKPCVLVLRQYYVDHKDSTFTQLKRAIHMLGVRHLWKVSTSPLRLTFIPSGQVILFRGLDDPLSITSITVEEGYLCWAWFEEMYQIENEKDFDKIDLSIRGELPYPLFKQLTGTLNPWSKSTWIKPRFFDVNEIEEDEDIFTDTTTYKNNEFLGKDDVRLFEKLRVTNPKRYFIEGEGNWGISEGLIYENWKVEYFDYRKMAKEKDLHGYSIYNQLYGLDFGYSNAPTAFVSILHKPEELKLYVFYEFYQKRMSNKEIFQKLKDAGFVDKKIKADSEDPKSIDELYMMGCVRMEGVKKGVSVVAGIQKLQDYEIIVHPRCTNFIEELNNYIWATDARTGNPLNKPVKKHDHLMDAMRYACVDLGGLEFEFI